jgi:hypothetical protein
MLVDIGAQKSPHLWIVMQLRCQGHGRGLMVKTDTVVITTQPSAHSEICINTTDDKR